MKYAVVILAAGQGKRMCSRVPKLLHTLADKPLLHHVLTTAQTLIPDKICVVHGHGSEQVKAACDNWDITWVEQSEQLGTGHAVLQAMPEIDDDHTVIVLCGDVPLVQAETLQQLLTQVASDKLGIITVNLTDPTGYGRIVRDNTNQVTAIVEQKDASTEIAAINEINTGIIAAPAKKLRHWLAQLTNDNAQKEYYLTDIVTQAVQDNTAIVTCQPEHRHQVMGVNDRVQLAKLERVYQQHQVEKLMLQGVTVRDPARVDIRGDVNAGIDIEIDINVIFEGTVTLGDGVKIGANCIIKDAHIAANTEILSHCVLDRVEVGKNCHIGPFARLRPDAVLAEQVRVGNFVEVKKSQISKGSKINHLSYIGDCEMGENVNIGAGTITCNYDGVNKYKTIIGDGAFIGSDTQLVAPVVVGAGSTIGAGSTVVIDTPADALTLSRSKQHTVYRWRSPKPKK